MKNKYYNIELAFFCILAIMCAVYGYLALQMPLGKLSNPAQGFFPGLMSLIGLVLSLICAATTLRKMRRTGEGEEPKGGVDFGQGSGFVTIALYIGMILFFIIFADIIGSYTCLFFLVLVLAKAQKLPGIVKPLVLAALSAVGFYLVFGAFLGVMLPKGFLI